MRQGCLHYFFWLSLPMLIVALWLQARSQRIADSWNTYEADIHDRRGITVRFYEVQIARGKLGVGFHVVRSNQPEAHWRISTLEDNVPPLHQRVRAAKSQGPIDSGGEYGFLLSTVPETNFYGDGSMTQFVVPFWLIAALSAVAPALMGFTLWRKRSAGRKGLCRHCGYDLRESPNRCPECGAPNTMARRRNVARRLAPLFLAIATITVILSASVFAFLRFEKNKKVFWREYHAAEKRDRMSARVSMSNRTFGTHTQLVESRNVTSATGAGGS